MNLSNNEIKSKLAQQFDVEIADYPVLSKLNGASGIDYLVLDEDQVLGSALEAIVKRIAKDSVSPYVLGMNGSICWISINEFKWEFCFDYLFDDSFQWLIIHNACDDTVLFLGADLVDVVKSVLGSDIESIEPFICRDFWYGVVKTHTSNLGLEYKHDTRRYFLSKTKIHCTDSSQPKNNFSIHLNEVDPYYRSGVSYSLLGIICSSFIVLAIVTRLVQWLNGSPAFDGSGHTQLIFYLLLVPFFGYKYYKTVKMGNNYEFRTLNEDKLAFTIPDNKKNPEETQSFLQIIVDSIHEATPSNQTILFLLGQYGLLTQMEWVQLESKIFKNENINESESNIIHLSRSNI